MANYRGHIVGGIITYVILHHTLMYTAIIPYYTSHTHACLYLALTLAGALFPDIDTYSKGRRLYDRGLLYASIILCALQNWLALLAIAILYVLPRCVRHRGVTHQIWFIIVASTIIAYTTTYYHPYYADIALTGAIFFISGALSHLILDFGIIGITRQINVKRK